jgi:hypothetical protein
MRSIRPFALVVAVVVTLPVSAALQVRQMLKSGDGSAPVERKLILSGTKVRVDEGSWSLIADSATGKIVQLYHDKKTWNESVAPQPAALSRDPVSSQFAAALAKSLTLVAEPSAIVVRPGTDTRTIAGVQTKRADVYRDGILARRSWLAESLTDADLLQFQTMLQMTDVGPLFYDELTMATRAALLGFTVRIEDVASGDVMETVEIRKDAPAASVFAPPAGYRKTE